MRFLALVPPDWYDNFAGRLYDGLFIEPLRALLANDGISLDATLIPRWEGKDDLNALHDVLGFEKPDGVLVCRCQQAEDPVISYLQSAGIGFVVFGHNDPNAAYRWVDVDNWTAFYSATKQLIAQGHQRIALINGPLQFSYASQRLAGYKRAMSEAELVIEPHFLLNGEPTFATGVLAGCRVLDDKIKPPTAVLCATLEMAEGVSTAAMSLGFRVPDELTLIGYCGIDPSAPVSEEDDGPENAIPCITFDATLIVKHLARQIRVLCGQTPKTPQGSALIETTLPPSEAFVGPKGKLAVPSALRSLVPEPRMATKSTYQAHLERAQLINGQGTWYFDQSTQSFVGTPALFFLLGLPVKSAFTWQELLAHLEELPRSRILKSIAHSTSGAILDELFPIKNGKHTRWLRLRGVFLIGRRGGIESAEGTLEDTTKAFFAKRVADPPGAKPAAA